MGNENHVMPQGNEIYGSDSGANRFPLLCDSARVAGTAPKRAAPAIVSGKEELLFYPGSSGLASGMVATGTRTGSATTTSSGSAAVTWGSEFIFAPATYGKIDGVSTGGILSGQITVGLKTSASTADCKEVAIRMRNNPTASTGDSSSWVTVLSYTATIACTTAEAFTTFDMPYLRTSASMNAVPYGLALGVQSNLASTNIIGRIMSETTYIHCLVVPGT